MNNYPERRVQNPNNPTAVWARELISDELKGQKKISIKISTHRAIQELSSQSNGATYDDIILAALSSYKREQEIGPHTLESIVTNAETEE
jgi:hypothetical protein